MATVSFPISKILHLFDEDINARRYTRAIKDMLGEEFLLACLVDHLKNTKENKDVEVLLDSNGNVRPPTTGGRGPRLDAWLKTPEKLYQVEIKFWSIHGVGAGALMQGKMPWGEYCEKLWGTYWNNKTGTFRDKSLPKTLTKMQNPEGYADSLKQIPLLCIWSPASPVGEEKPEPLFNIKTHPNMSYDFEEFYVFSVSNFLRQKEESTGFFKTSLSELPQKMDLINSLFALEVKG